MSTTASPRTTPGVVSPPQGRIDPRGPQFTAALTAVVLVAVLLLPGPTLLVAALAALVGAAVYAGLAWLVLGGLVREILADVRGALRRPPADPDGASG